VTQSTSVTYLHITYYKNIMKKTRGFTLIELLIIVGVLGILLLIGLSSLNGIKEKGRDAKRINDITNLQQAMEIVSEEAGDYQMACGGVDYQGLVSQCQGDTDEFLLNEYWDSIETINDPMERERLCDDNCSRGVCNYAFQYIENDSYSVKFWLERQVGEYASGCHMLTERGIR